MGRLYVRQTFSGPFNVTECDSIPILVPSDPPNNPPYSLIVYNDLDSLPRVYPLPSEQGVGRWTVPYSAATTLVYRVVDSEAKSVGNPEEVKVQATTGSKACLQPPANFTNRLELSADIVRDFDTCSPLNIRIDGGQKPYTVSLVPIKGAPPINVTLGANDDSLYWVNLLQPNITLVVTASDSKGLHASSQQFVTGGNRITDICPGQITHSFNSRDPLGQKSQTTSTAIGPTRSIGISNGDNANSQNDGGRTTTIVGGTMGGIILLGLLFIFYHLRKRQLERRRGSGLWGKDEPVSSYIPDPVPFYSGGSMNQIGIPSTSFGHSYNVKPGSSSGQNGVAGAGLNATSRKAARAEQETAVSTLTPMDQGSGGVQVRQHTDAMGIIELPPAYRDAPPIDVSDSKQ